MTSISALSASFRGVTRLLGFGCPSAVAGFIVPVVVDAVDARSWGFSAHINDEVEKEKPSVAYFNSPPSIMLKSIIFWVGASVLHRRPRSIGWGYYSVHSMPMYKTVFAPDGGSHD